MKLAVASLLAAAALGAEPFATDGVRLGGTWFEAPVRRAVRAAAERLTDPSCAQVLARFADATGRGLDQRLADSDQDAASYTRRLLFYDGSNDAPCRRPRTWAFTSPGSRVVHVCPTLGWLADRDPAQAQAVVIHEVLHTLGLQTDVPSSDEITAAVEKRCSR